MGQMQLQGINTDNKSLFYTIIVIFRLNDNVYTLEGTAGQSWPNYIGPNREKPKACLTNRMKVAWSGMSLIVITPLRMFSNCILWDIVHIGSY